MASKIHIQRALSQVMKLQNARALNSHKIVKTPQRNHGAGGQENSEDERGGGDDSQSRRRLATALFLGGGAIGFAAYQYYRRRNRVALLSSAQQRAVQGNVPETGAFIEGLPVYTVEEVAKHSTLQDGVWVTYKQGVYDVTPFVDVHPGGESIMLAAGGSVEPFWLLYAAHRSAQVSEIMRRLRIGNLSAAEAADAVADMSDPYANDPRRHHALQPTSVKPFNAEPPAALLVDSFITPNELFYVRNHLPVPEVDPNTYELEVECEGGSKSVALSLDAIKKYEKHTVTATIMCAGNRRSEMTQVKAVKGLEWRNAAVGTATWSGARLADVLADNGIEHDAKYQHIQFEGMDLDPTSKPYGASIPAWKAFDRRCDVILAYEMNGEPLPRDHGYPIRVIVPGVVGARSVKWLGRITLASAESDSHWQQNDYKGFSPSTDWDSVDFGKSPAIQELPVISSICRPAEGDHVQVVDGAIIVQGYAWSGGGQKIVRVDVTADGGDTWHVASLDQQDDQPAPLNWAWTLWSARIPVASHSQTVEIWAKAVDASYNTQPESFKNIWNLRGVLSNAYHRVTVHLKWDKPEKRQSGRSVI